MKGNKEMKRYSISYAYSRNRETNKITFHYDGRTDFPEETIKRYLKGVEMWAEKVTDESYEYRDVVDDYIGIRITDSQTKAIVYENVHLSEEFGWKKVWEHRHGTHCSYWHGEWVRV
jgi:hypothetical protein